MPDFDAFSFDLRGPYTATVLVKGVTKGTGRSDCTTNATAVVAIGIMDFYSTLLSCHDAFGGLGARDLIASLIGDGLNDL